MGPAILIIDDEVAICDNLGAYLEDDGMEIHVAHSGEDALRLLEAGLRVRVCVMDLRLPGISGAQAVVRIHHLRPDIRFIIHTGSAHDAVLTELRHLGLDPLPVFNKPVCDLDGLARAILRLCAPA